MFEIRSNDIVVRNGHLVLSDIFFSFQEDKTLKLIQKRLSQLLYRYLSSKETSDSMELNPEEKASLLINLVDDLHDCVDIMNNRSLLVHSGQ